MDLKGKRALVTGGAVRVGRAIVEALQAAGAEVVVHYLRSGAEAKALSPWTVKGDLADPEACSRIVAEAGPLDILVNNASLFTRDALPTATPERVRREFGVNLFAPMELVRAFAAQVRGEGAVVNLLDRRIRGNDTTCAPYLLTKKALADFTRVAALEYAPAIRVNAVAPGPVLPPSGGAATEPMGHIPLGRPPVAGDVAGAVLFLLRAESITGQVVFVDGGQHLLGNGA